MDNDFSDSKPDDNKDFSDGNQDLTDTNQPGHTSEHDTFHNRPGSHFETETTHATTSTHGHQYAGSAAQLSQTDGIKQRRFFRSQAYLPEYFVMLVLLFVVMVSVLSLVRVGADSLIQAESASSATSLLYGDMSAWRMVSSLSALVACLPVFVWLFVRTRNSEMESPDIRQYHWRKVFLGGFLVALGLMAVWTVGRMAYYLLMRVFDETSGILATSRGVTNPWWQEVLVAALSVALLSFVIFVLSRDYRSKEVR